MLLAEKNVIHVCIPPRQQHEPLFHAWMHDSAVTWYTSKKENRSLLTRWRKCVLQIQGSKPCSCNVNILNDYLFLHSFCFMPMGNLKSPSNLIYLTCKSFDCDTKPEETHADSTQEGPGLKLNSGPSWCKGTFLTTAPKWLLLKWNVFDILNNKLFICKYFFVCLSSHIVLPSCPTIVMT